MTPKEQEAYLLKKVGELHTLANWMANQEARSAWVKGVASQGALFA